MDINHIRSILEKNKSDKGNIKIFFKTGPGDYAENDNFLGVSVPIIRKIAKNHKDLSITEIKTLILSPYNEERLLALFILTAQYKKSSEEKKEQIYQFYIQHLQYVNNWNLVDCSAHLIIGAHLYKKDKALLEKLAQSNILWEKRIAIIATLYFIHHNNFDWTFTIARLLLNDTHDLIHKATGWMLREVGKRNEHILIHFLDQYAKNMPRTMLRYAIEKLPEDIRKNYLNKKRSSN